ncbi:uncharacterized protein A1O5_05084 [Cladophialophora psammophila CBS 110553]|uniref:Ribosomal RNA-processing protein 1 n=1 Tax=Cladophialophora psammophila CBS 110553 TaxID=1182543 RepID=W9WTK6_9EURO|nr:uncharacterized protein A1O5_05084 [Cladophialophora psammophila CBS 110553]EXJ71278.1 hypothetical protein A1O5_05084 [Cladophialophora psammophila CBS 110553]
MAQHAEAATIPSVKDLASSEASVRRACLNTIMTYLNDQSASSPLTLTECLQIWRGFYVGLYMHDSRYALSVQSLVAELAGTLRIMNEKDRESTADELDSQSKSWLDTWTAAFWETVCREWSSIDQWRMNKVLLLVRFIVRELFNLTLGLVSTGEPASQHRIARQLQILEIWPLSPRERKVPDGMRLHVLDIWVEELAGQLSAAQKVVDESGQSDGEEKKVALLATAKAFMAPLDKLSKEALSKGVKLRAKEAIKLAEEKILGMS